MTENKEVKGKKRSVSNLTIPHSKNQYTRAKKKVDKAKMCYVKITIKTKI